MEEEDSCQERLLKVIEAICEWLFPPQCRKATVLLRAYALVWFMRPNWLGNPTQVELAKVLGVSKQTLGKVINQLRDKFGFYVAGMRHEEARAKFAANAKRHSRKLAKARRLAFNQKQARQVLRATPH